MQIISIQFHFRIAGRMKKLRTIWLICLFIEFSNYNREHSALPNLIRANQIIIRRLCITGSWFVIIMLWWIRSWIWTQDNKNSRIKKVKDVVANEISTESWKTRLETITPLWMFFHHDEYFILYGKFFNILKYWFLEINWLMQWNNKRIARIVVKAWIEDEFTILKN